MEIECLVLSEFRGASTVKAKWTFILVITGAIAVVGVLGVRAFCQSEKPAPAMRVVVSRDENDMPWGWHYYMDSAPFLSIFDRDKDGTPEEVWLYEKGSQTRLEVTFLPNDGMRVKYRDVDGRRVRTEENLTSADIKDSEDWPANARWQHVRYYGKRGRLLREETYYPSGVTRRRVSYDADGDPVIEEHCNASTGAVYYRVFYEKYVRRLIEVDTDGDGRMDKIQRLDEKGDLIAEEYDRDGDGWLDEKKDIEPGQ
jgi:hypothetical protein